MVTSVNKLVSIIMPVFNGQDYISDAIKSVTKQTYTDWELIVVDDGSTDDTSNIIASFDDDRIHYIHKANGGQSSALNRGLESAAGEFITTLDADDMMTSDSLRLRAEYLKNFSGVGAVYSDGYYTDMSGKPFRNFSDNLPDNPEGDIYNNLIISNFISNPGLVLIRANVIQRYGLRYNESIVIGEDWDFLIRVAERVRFGYINSVGMYYRLHSSNMTVTKSERRVRDAVSCRQTVLSSDRFSRVPEAQKMRFFYSYLLDDLGGHYDEQQRVMMLPSFRALTSRVRARLTWLVGTDCLVRGGDAASARRWLFLSWRLRPRDPLPLLLGFLTVVSPNAAGLAVRTRRMLRRGRRWMNPFEITSRRLQCRRAVAAL